MSFKIREDVRGVEAAIDNSRKGGKRMRLRKLDSSEHGLTRGLWEKVFSDDSKKFLDYYYFIKTRDNQIYMIEEDGAIRSMLHLNPYVLQVEEEQFRCHYIIAVATEAEYRKRGYMGELLRASMMDMYARKEPFTFLMPAAEAIYTPYDFRFIYKQNQEEILGKEGSPGVELKDAELGDAAEMAEFFRKYYAPAYQVYAIRDENYYQTMIFEQMSENGGVKLMKQGGRIVGMFAYAREKRVEIREPLYLPEYEEEFQKAVYVLRAGEDSPVKILAACGKEEATKVPVIMVRILHLQTLLESIHVKAGEKLDCSFAVLDTIITANSRVWKLQGGGDNPAIQVQETEDSQGVLTISALASLLFGYKTLEEICEEEDVIVSEELACELRKTQPLERVYLNEIV
jgi:predicted acetyltransferase